MEDRSIEMQAFRNAKDRCLKPHHRRYQDYGGRGIIFHEAWINDFDAFYDHVGARPSPGHSLGRIDNDLGYQPGNLEWQTKQQQAKATSRSYSSR